MGGDRGEGERKGEREKGEREKGDGQVDRWWIYYIVLLASRIFSQKEIIWSVASTRVVQNYFLVVYIQN